MKQWTILWALLLPTLCLLAQDQGTFSGSLESNANFFMRDTAIGASDTPQYDNELAGGEFWLNLNYNYKGFDLAMRFDAFYNSNLRIPTGSYTAQGIGYWHIRKKIDKLDITVGHIYDQIGSGIIFRSYEARPLFIDNALVGLRLNYDLIEKDNFSLMAKAFMGRQRRPFQDDNEGIVSQAYRQAIRGVSLDGFWTDGKKLSLAPGLGIVNRTLDDNSMNQVVSNMITQATGPGGIVDTTQIFTPAYNVYAMTLYNTLTYGNFSGYGEVAYKTQEAISNPIANDSLYNRDGLMAYGSMSYSEKGIGGNLEAKYTRYFTLRVSPFEELNNGLLNFLPPMARQNTYRLAARYNAATQEIGELAFLADFRYSPIKTLTFNLFGSYINDLDNTALFREAHLNVSYRKPREYALTAGFQYLQYNQDRFEQKPGVPLVDAYVPYVDFQYKFTKKLSLRAEAQYMYSEQDYGQWAFGLLELGFAPNWIITVSDMVNTRSNVTKDFQHYPTAGVVYSHKTNRFNLSYVKQVEGVVCTGGICRLEPAFSGVKFNVTSSF